MCAALKRPGTVRFRGAPTGLSAVLRVEKPKPGPVEVSVELPIEVEAPLTAQLVTEAGTDVASMIVRLPERVPPGTYKGKVVLDDREQDIVIEVEPRPRARILPKRTAIRGAPGQRANFEVTIVNRGNVDLEVPKADAFGLFAEDGMDRALGVALGERPKEGGRRIDLLADELSASHGGVAKLHVVDGAGAIAPGDARDVTLAVQIPKQARPGRSYWGVWSFYNVNYMIEVEATAEVK